MSASKWENIYEFELPFHGQPFMLAVFVANKARRTLRVTYYGNNGIRLEMHVPIPATITRALAASAQRQGEDRK